MKRAFRHLAVVVALLGATGLATVAADVLATLNLSEREATEQVMAGITSGSTPYGAHVEAFRTLSGAARGAVAEQLGTWVKAYVSSQAFRTAYTAYRTSQKPEPPTFEGTVDEEFARQQAEMLAQFAETRKNLGQLPADQRSELEEVIKQSEAQMKSPEMQKLVRDGIVADRAGREEGYRQEITAWESRYPEDPKPLVARRLRAFLDSSADVDFAAQLTAKDGRMLFANPKYEAKPAEWKRCFRAGQEAVVAARAIATAWLKEIGG